MESVAALRRRYRQRRWRDFAHFAGGQSAKRLDFADTIDKNNRFRGRPGDASWDASFCQFLMRRGASGPAVVDIEQLKQDFTDKYVVVDAARPELKRFEGHVGQIKTVNMNGRALVQFDAWNNIGWYDIGLDYLQVVPKPEASAVEGKKKEAAKPAKAAAKPAEGAADAAADGKKLSPLEMARMQAAAKKPGAQPAPSGEKKSTADILAAARANKSAGTAAPAPAAAPKPAAAGAKMSTADILAAARAKKAAEAAPAETTAVAEAEPAMAEPAPVDEVKAASARPAAAKEAPAAFPPGQRPTVPQILDWWRKHDAK